MTHSESTDVCLLLYPFRKSARNEWIPHKLGVLPRQRRFSIRLLQNSVPAWSVQLSPWVMWHYYGMFSGRLALFFCCSSQQIFHQNTSLPSNVRACDWEKLPQNHTQAGKFSISPSPVNMLFYLNHFDLQREHCSALRDATERWWLGGGCFMGTL